jgi:hypothetical protein
MKLTKSKLLQFINESMNDDSRILQALMDILGAQKETVEKLEDLDVSMDYVASALTNTDPLGIQIRQKTLGRKAAMRSIEDEIE